MIHKISVIISDQLVKQNSIDLKYKSVYEYGIELMLSSLIGILLILFVGTVFFSIIDAVIFLITFISIRTFCGGYHAKSYLTCNMCSILSFVVVSCISRTDMISKPIIILILALSSIILFYISPIEHKNKPIDLIKKNRLKLISIVFFLIFCMISLIIENWNEQLFKQLAYTLIIITMFAAIGHVEQISQRKE